MISLQQAIIRLVEISDRGRPAGNLMRDTDAARVIVEALKTRDGAKACSELVWAEIGEPEQAEKIPGPSREEEPPQWTADERKERRAIAAQILAGFCANPVLYKPAYNIGGEPVAATESMMTAYALDLADGLIQKENNRPPSRPAPAQ